MLQRSSGWLGRRINCSKAVALLDLSMYEVIADNLHDAEWSYGYVSALDRDRVIA